MTCSLANKIFSITIFAIVSHTVSPAFAQSCHELDGISFQQNALYAITRTDKAIKKTLLSNLPFAKNDLIFDNKIRLIFVLDQPASQINFLAVKRDFSGVLAVRLVSTSADGKLRPPSVVYLKRDRITTRKARRGVRPEWEGEVGASRYYVYHNPKEIRASDSFLERQFHTYYRYKANEPERNTFQDRQRRSKFHYPEMTADTPVGGFVGLIANLFGGGSALASGTESRFESQIKYYSDENRQVKEPEPRCVAIETRIDESDNGQLKITISDLDYPGSVIDASDSWIINWTKPKLSTSN